MELTLTALTKRFQDLTAVREVSCTLTNGVYGLLGVNGAGKTTLMRLLCTLLTPTSGQVSLDGQDIFQMGAEYRRRLGYLPQDFGYYPDFSVFDYLLYIGSIKGLRPATARKRGEALLEQVGLTAARNKKMKRLSGGMKRRVGIAQAMLNDPEILILDEPTAGLDPSERIRFRNLLAELSQSRLVLLSTHIVSDVEHIAHQILLMKAGAIVQTGAPAELTAALPTGVWRVEVPQEQVEGYLRRFQVANLRTTGTGAELRILAPTPPAPQAVREPATLEDLFLHHFGERTGEDHDTI